MGEELNPEDMRPLFGALHRHRPWTSSIPKRAPSRPPSPDSCPASVADGRLYEFRKLGKECRAGAHRSQAGCPSRGVRLEVDVWPEEEDARSRSFRCGGAPCHDPLPPIGAAVAPVDQQQPDLPRWWQVRRIADPDKVDTRALGGSRNARGDDQVAGNECDRHSARAGAGSRMRTGWGWTPLPLDPLKAAPSVR